MPETRTCAICRRDVPIRPADEEGESPTFRNHAAGLRQGACPASGEPVDVEPKDFYDVEPETDEDRAGHGKPPEAA